MSTFTHFKNKIGLCVLLHVSFFLGDKSNGKDESEESDGNIPNFCVLLHGALKVATQNYAAMCEVGLDWFGFIHAFSDSKKKSNLILSILPQGKL